MQALIDSVAKSHALNPSMNSVVDAFDRRRFSGRFKTDHQSIELDTLLHQTTSSTLKDSDEAVNKMKKSPVGQRSEHSQGEAFCYAFQTVDSIRRNCTFRHWCSVCRSPHHGSLRCPRVQHRDTRPVAPRTTQSSQNQWERSQTAKRPPHPRYRRDRVDRPR